MGRRGTSYHARGQHTAEQFATIGVSCAIIAVNNRWATFAVLDEIDTASIAAALDSVVLRIDADDDHGSHVSFFAPDGWSAELVVELVPDDLTLASADRDLLAELTRRDVLTDGQCARLQEQLEKLGNRSDWLEQDGLEKELGVADARPLPVPVTRDALKALGSEVEIIKPRKQAAKKATKLCPLPTPGPIDPRVLAVHIYYWRNVFEMNGWVLYNKYKKHLPAERRREVDHLVDLSVRGGEPGELAQEVERILSAVWLSADWAAAVRDPRLARDETLSSDRLAAWELQLNSLPAAQA
jgi:hypothetical protein